MAVLRRRRPSGINPHGGVLSLAIIEGRNFEATPPDSRLIYLKIRSVYQEENTSINTDDR